MSALIPPPRWLGYALRVAAVGLATLCVLAALKTGDEKLADFVEWLFGDIGDDSGGLDDASTWASAALVAAALVVTATFRGVWVDVVVAVTIGLLAYAVVDQYDATDKAIGKKAPAAAREELPPPPTLGSVRFALPGAKVRAPGTDLKLPRVDRRRAPEGKDQLRTLDVTVVLAVPVRDAEGRTLRVEPRQHDAALAATVTTKGAKQAVPVDIQSDTARFAADVTAAEAIYLLRAP